MPAKTCTTILQPEPEGGFTVTVPSLPGCVTYGETVKQAKTMAEDAVMGFLASLQKHREEIPSDDSALMTAVTIETDNLKSYA